MTPRRATRTQQCDRRDARIRLEHARSFLDVADLVGTDRDELATPSVSSALAVLSAIAASDAVCCAVLSQRARGQDHQQSVALLRTVTPDGPDMAPRSRTAAGDQGRRPLRPARHQQPTSDERAAASPPAACRGRKARPLGRFRSARRTALRPVAVPKPPGSTLNDAATSRRPVRDWSAKFAAQVPHWRPGSGKLAGGRARLVADGGGLEIRAPAV